MGYTTDFYGSFKFNKPVSCEFRDYINAFSDTRHMKRDPDKIVEIHSDWKSRCFNGNLGNEGEYFIANTHGFMEELSDESILNINIPPESQPGLWCQWVVTDDCMELEWDGGEKFYNYVTWLMYIINNFIEPSGYAIDGDVEWQGEDYSDHGVIHVNNNKVETEICSC